MATTLERPPKPLRAPGPRGHWLTGHLDAFRRDRLGFLEHCAREYGDFVSIRLGPKRILIVNHPDAIEEVLVAQNRRFIKHFALRKGTERTLGNGLLTSEGDSWRRQRRLSQPAFHRDRIAGYGRIMVEHGLDLVGEWADGRPIDLHEDLMRVTMRIVAKTLFDADFAREARDASRAMDLLLDAYTRRVARMLPVPEWLPTPMNLRVNRAIGSLDRLLYRVVAERRASGEDRGDLLSMLLAATDPETDGTGMSDHQLRDELMTLFLAGHETTANTIAWAFHLLARHPDEERRLHEELDEVLGDRPPDVDDLPRLSVTGRVVTETLRVLPAVWLLGREATEPATIGGYPVAPGETVYMSQWVVHRDPRWFDDPASFRPTRWLGDLAQRIPRYAYFPFGGGPRICVGNRFALMEASLLVATIASRYRLEAVGPDRVALLPTMTLRPRDGLPMVPRRRR